MLSLHPLIEAAELNDTRRNDRLFACVAALVAGGAVRASENASWAHTMACYRFYQNDAVPLHALYDVVRDAVRAQLPKGARVYLAHDPSLLDFSRHNTKRDRVPIGDHRGRGYELYSVLALDADGRPLGPVFQEVRTARGCHSSEPLPPSARRRAAPFVGHIEQMEKAVDTTREQFAEFERVHVADCEFDDLALQRGMFAADPPERYIVRAQHLTRRVLHDDVPCHLKDAAEAVVLKRMHTVEREGVRYRQYVGETKVVLDGLSRRGRHRGETPKHGEPIEVRVVVAELRARGHETLRWVLLTNLSDPILDVVRAYVWRWKIERYFFLTKVGFRLEEWTQQDGERLARRLAVASLAALVIHRLLSLKDDPEREETLKEIARRGNWLGRKCDPIGPIVLMRGMMRVLEALALVEQLGAAKIRSLAEEILPGISRETQASRRRRDV